MVMLCPACGARNEETVRFCIQCGTSLREPLRSSVLPRRRAIFLTLGAAVVLGAVIVGLYSLFMQETIYDYYPIGPEGQTWMYVEKLRGIEDQRIKHYTRYVTLMGEQIFEGEKAYLYVTRNEEHSLEQGGRELVVGTTKSYFMPSRNVIKLVRIEVDAENTNSRTKIKYTPGLTILKAPLRVGITWEETIDMEMSRTRGEEVVIPPDKFKLTISRTIVAKEWVTLPAGTFKALKVESRDKTGKLDSTFWYAKGIGMVKEVLGSLAATDNPYRETELSEVRSPK